MRSSSLILNTAALAIVPLQLMFSVFLLLRGHDEPGGGFIGGLVAASAFVLYAFSFGARSTLRLLRVSPRDILAAGLLFALASTIPALLSGQPLLTAHWWQFPLPGESYLKLSTVLIFDIGVYLAVLGTLMTFVISLMEVRE